MQLYQTERSGRVPGCLLDSKAGERLRVKSYLRS